MLGCDEEESAGGDELADEWLCGLSGTVLEDDESRLECRVGEQGVQHQWSGGGHAGGSGCFSFFLPVYPSGWMIF